jgi:hypothetical protein
MRLAWGVPVLLVVLAGCTPKHEDKASELHFDMQADTLHLSEGPRVLDGVETTREAGGALRMRGRFAFPDGARIQISVYRHGEDALLGRVQVLVESQRFESPPIMGVRGPLPRAAYRIEYQALFNPAWQSPDVMRATDDGRALRGPGMTRDRLGAAAFYLIEERTL